MHPRTRRRTRTLASATVLALLAVPSAAVAAPDPSPQPDARAHGAVALGTSGPQAAPLIDPADKFTAGATRAFASDDTADFWLRFAEKPDLSAAEGITSWSERGDYVYETLLAAAEASQKDAVAELEEAGTRYTSYWATNAIFVEGGSLDLATDLAADAQVLEVRPTTHYEAPEPVEAKAAPNEAEAAAEAAAEPTWGVAAINADDLWAQGITGEGIVVAGIDTGVDTAIDSVKAQYRGDGGSDDYNWYDAAGIGQPSPGDTAANGHGTHTMGSMVGGTVWWNQVQHQFGVAPGAEWIATNGCAAGCMDRALIRSGQWILAPTRADGTRPDTAKRPHIVNNSWGSRLPSTDPFMEDIITAWEAAGIFATFSAGNMGEDGCQSSGSPGSRQASYAVGAFTESGRIAPYSARGTGQDGIVKPDIAAPGDNVFSALPGGHMGILSGTSMAAPHVAGAVALLWDAVPELVGNVQATRAILDGSAEDMSNTSCGGTADDNNVWGEGRLDVLAAYDLAQAQAFDTTTVPTISGDEYLVGEPLTATVEAWSPAATFTYHWRRTDPANGTSEMIPDATRATYTPQAADLGANLTVTVVGSADGRTPTSTTSTATPVIAPGRPTASVPTISGKVRVGSTLRALAGSWTSGTGFSYQWYANGTAVRGATGFSFTPTSAQRGKRLTVRIVGTRAGYTTVSRTSGASAAVASGAFSQSAPAISGVATPGATLKVSRPQSTPTPGAVGYRWKLDGRSIRGATGSSLSVRSSWKGRTITVSATVRRTGYTTRTVTSAGAKVGSKYSASPSPRISGTARVGSRLRVTVGRWSPKPSFSYRWYADGVPISGATSSTYSLKGPDYGKRITVSVRTYRGGYGTATRFSSATRAVLTSAVRFPGDDESGWLVGNGSVPPVTYIAQAGSAMCTWQRQSFNAVLARDTGLGQRMVKVQSTDHSIWSTTSCGTWTKYYPGMTTTRASTAAHGTYAIGDHLERGVYSTTGPKDPSNEVCHYIFYKGFYGVDAVLSHDIVTGARTVTMPKSATGFETVGCSWKRIG
ncbi:S8 family serine peptidase [Promicromonospora iranensis]|uniref:S8 family serine peptidase n=1 Tax=Promicromonospora iranensis TaxID=1105144 RepID=UPI0023A9440C|nr:S8 family serine peptidase [Promicromonospora iranensis]